MPIPKHERGRTHWEGCWRDPAHHACTVAEVERLRADCTVHAEKELERLERAWSAARAEALEEAMEYVMQWQGRGPTVGELRDGIRVLKDRQAKDHKP